MATAILRAYQAQFDTHPHATLAATNGALSAVADVVAQTAQMIVGTLNSPGARYLCLKLITNHAIVYLTLLSTAPYF